MLFFIFNRFLITYRKFLLSSICILLLIISLIDISIAGKYNSGDTYKNIINHDLTLDKIHMWEYNVKNNNDNISLEKLRFYSGQMIFWKGYINNFQKKNGYFFTLNTGEKTVNVYCGNNVRNLDFNRNGCKAGIKGRIVIKDDKFSHIEGKSVILMIPPAGKQYRDFQLKYKINPSFILNTTRGQIKMTDDFYPFIIHWVFFLNPHYDTTLAETIAKATIYYGHKNNIDSPLLLALFTIESAMDYDAVSSGGAIGIGQLMPLTAKAHGVDPYDPFQNIGASVIHFKGCLNEWKGYENGLDLALASYNAGSGAVSYYGGIPPYSETQNYVFFVKLMYRLFTNYIL